MMEACSSAKKRSSHQRTHQVEHDADEELQVETPREDRAQRAVAPREGSPRKPAGVGVDKREQRRYQHHPAQDVVQVQQTQVHFSSLPR
jgi:hypothetical protein